MYLPAHFEQARPEANHALIRDHPLGLLVTPDLQANAVPFLVDAQPAPWGTLRAHVARANPVWREADGREVLVLFQGPQAYVSPGWYPGKAEHGKVVPTWNYVLVQARGRLKAVDDPAWLRALVTRLTDTHEAAQPRPWSVDDAPADYIAATLRAIVGIEIELTGLVGKCKLSQNRGTADREGVIAGLEAAGGDARRAVASAMSSR